jgi:hypothetical protein
MENYALRGHGTNHYMTIIEELKDSFFVRMVKDRGGREDVSVGFIDKDFFDTCIRTGHFVKLEALKQKVAEPLKTA